jgi:hypothetical protein
MPSGIAAGFAAAAPAAAVAAGVGCGFGAAGPGAEAVAVCEPREPIGMGSPLLTVILSSFLEVISFTPYAISPGLANCRSKNAVR